MKLTILEGPDGAGKSTLAASLAKAYEARGERVVVHHHGPYEHVDDLAPIYLNSFSTRLYPRVDHVILDRSWLSEPIYGAVFRGGADRVGVVRRRMLTRAALACEAVVIGCWNDNRTMLANAVTRAKDAYVVEKFSDVANGYANLYQTYDELPFGYYNYETTRLPRFIDLMDDIRTLPNGGPGVGEWRPGESVLLVGERVSTADGPGALPFVSWRGNASCAHWLTARLAEAGVPERALYWANAFDENDVMIDIAWINALRPRAIFLMGYAANEWVSRSTINWSKLRLFSFTHPQYWKRFHAREPYPLVAAVKAAVVVRS